MDPGEFERRLGGWLEELDDIHEGQRFLREALAEARERLLERLEVVEQREAIDQALALKQAKVSVDAECMKYHRYRLESERGSQASLRLLHQLQRMRLNYGEQLGATVEAPEPAPSGGDCRPESAAAAGAESPAQAAGEAVHGNEADATQVADGPAGTSEPGTFSTVKFTIGRSAPTSDRKADGFAEPSRGDQGGSEVVRE
jgi:hypothetical protein